METIPKVERFFHTQTFHDEMWDRLCIFSEKVCKIKAKLSIDLYVLIIFLISKCVTQCCSVVEDRTHHFFRKGFLDSNPSVSTTQLRNIWHHLDVGLAKIVYLAIIDAFTKFDVNTHEYDMLSLCGSHDASFQSSYVGFVLLSIHRDFRVDFHAISSFSRFTVEVELQFLSFVLVVSDLSLFGEALHSSAEAVEKVFTAEFGRQKLTHFSSRSFAT